MAPAQPILLEVQTLQHSRRGAKGIEGAEGVGNEIRIKFAITAHGAAHVGLCLEQQSVPTSLGQPIGSHQSIRAGADDNRIHLVRQCHTLTSADMTSKHRLTACYGHPSS